MLEIIPELRRELMSRLNPSRYEHTLSVSFTAASLAMCHGHDPDKAELAGLLHDCAKHYSNEAIIKRCKKEMLPLTEDELKAPAVLHAKYGAWLAKTRYNVTDPEILWAIRWHTTGRPAMSPLEEIIFVADYVEPRRDEAPNLPVVRPLAFSDLKECIYLILKDTLIYLDGKGCFVDSMTNQAYEYYRRLHEEKKGK